MATLNHVALSVPNLEAALAWYQKHFNLSPPLQHTFDRAQDPSGTLFKLYGPSLQKAKVGWLFLSDNKTVIEFFEFLDPALHPQKKAESAKEDFENLQNLYQRGGIFHFCLTVEDPVLTAQEVKGDGGAIIGEVDDLRGSGGPVVAYVRDPWGNVVELVDCGMDVMLLGAARD